MAFLPLKSKCRFLGQDIFHTPYKTTHNKNNVYLYLVTFYLTFNKELIITKFYFKHKDIY